MKPFVGLFMLLLSIQYLQAQNVGIGITTPTAALDIAGPLSSGSASLLLRNGDPFTGFLNRTQIRFGYENSNQYQHYIRTRHNNGTSPNAIDFFVSDGTANGVFPTNAILNLSLVSGNVGIGNLAPAAKLDVTGNAIISGNVGIGNISPAAKLDVTGNALISGNVGIGNLAPAAKLDVTGTIKIADGSQGNGRLLTSDANGLAKWANPNLANGTQKGNMPYWDGTKYVDTEAARFFTFGTGNSPYTLTNFGTYTSTIIFNIWTQCIGSSVGGVLFYDKQANVIKIISSYAAGGSTFTAATNVLSVATVCGGLWTYTFTPSGTDVIVAIGGGLPNANASVVKLTTLGF